MATVQEKIAEIEATKPKRESFQTEEEFEEALNRWMSRQGRTIALLRSQVSPPKSP